MAINHKACVFWCEQQMKRPLQPIRDLRSLQSSPTNQRPKNTKHKSQWLYISLLMSDVSLKTCTFSLGPIHYAHHSSVKRLTSFIENEGWFDLFCGVFCLLSVCLRSKILCFVCLCRSEEPVETESAPSAEYKSPDPAGREDFTWLNPVKGRFCITTSVTSWQW